MVIEMKKPVKISILILILLIISIISAVANFKPILEERTRQEQLQQNLNSVLNMEGNEIKESKQHKIDNLFSLVINGEEAGDYASQIFNHEYKSGGTIVYQEIYQYTAKALIPFCETSNIAKKALYDCN